MFQELHCAYFLLSKVVWKLSFYIKSKPIKCFLYKTVSQDGLFENNCVREADSRVRSEQCLAEHFNKSTLPRAFPYPLGRENLSAESNDFWSFNCPEDLYNAIKTHSLPTEKFGSEIINKPR